MAKKPPVYAPPLIWGEEHEDVAIREYEKKTGLKVRETGIWIFPNTHLAASPDGLVLDPTAPNKIIGCLEIKCPWRLRNFTIKKSSDWKTQLDYLDQSNSLLHSHPYYHQIQGEIFGTNLEWCDFAIWCPSGIIIQRIFLDKQWQEEVLPKLERIYKNSYIREEDYANFDYVRKLESMKEIDLADVLSINNLDRRKVFRAFIFCLALHFARWTKKFQLLGKGPSNWEECCNKFMEQSRKSFCETCFVKLFIFDWQRNKIGEAIPDELTKIKNCKWVLPPIIVHLAEMRARKMNMNLYFTWDPCMCVKV